MKDRIQVYKNLHKNCFSVRYKGKVITHLPVSSFTVLKDVEFRVQPKGNEKVNQTKQKNVHAYVSGTVHMYTEQAMRSFLSDSKEVSYNPYRGNSFFLIESDTDVIKANKVILHNNKVYAIGAE